MGFGKIGELNREFREHPGSYKFGYQEIEAEAKAKVKAEGQIKAKAWA